MIDTFRDVAWGHFVDTIHESVNGDAWRRPRPPLPDDVKRALDEFRVKFNAIIDGNRIVTALLDTPNTQIGADAFDTFEEKCERHGVRLDLWPRNDDGDLLP